MSEILDSGERRTFESGAVRDMQEGKGRFDLLPMCVLMRLAKHYEKGAIKYKERNWEKGIPAHSFADSAMRHLVKYLDGWIDEDHLIAAIWNLMGLAWTEEKKPEMMDIPSRLNSYYFAETEHPDDVADREKKIAEAGEVPMFHGQRVTKDMCKYYEYRGEDRVAKCFKVDDGICSFPFCRDFERR